MPEQIWWTLAEFCTRLGLNERHAAKCLAYAPQRPRGARTEYNVRVGSALIFLNKLHEIDPSSVCHACLQPRELFTGRDRDPDEEAG